MSKLPELEELLKQLPNYSSKELVELLYSMLVGTTATLEEERAFIYSSSSVTEVQNNIVVNYNSAVLDKIEELFGEEYDF